MTRKTISIIVILSVVALFAAAVNWTRSNIPAAAAVWSGAVSLSDGGDIRVRAEGVVLMDSSTGQVLFRKNDKKRLYPASTTKIVTAMIALEKGKPNEMVTVGDEANLRTPGESSAGLRQGQKLALSDLIAAMMLPSGNDAARTVARYIAGKEAGKSLSAEEGIRTFVKMMNDKAKQLGANNTLFANPHGLHDPNHYTTASDMALLAKKAMENKLFRQTVSEQEHNVALARTTMTLENRNKLLQPDSGFYFEGANGIKTGFTDEAGYCLVASATRDGKRLIAVVLKSSSTDVWLDSYALLEYGFESAAQGRKQPPSAAQSLIDWPAAGEGGTIR